MRYADLLDLYFRQSNMLQILWTVYVVVIGGLLAVAAIRRQPDFLAGVLATVLYCSFAYKNMSAITDLTEMRFATLVTIQQYQPVADENEARLVKLAQTNMVPTLHGTSSAGVRSFHLFCDAVTMATMWGLQLNRLRRSRAGSV